MLKYRLITGPILIALLLGIIWLDDRLDTVVLTGGMRDFLGGRETLPPGLILLGLALLAALPAALELNAIFAAQGIRTRRWLTVLAAELGLLICYLVPTEMSTPLAVFLLASIMIALFVLSLIVFSRDQQVAGVLAAGGAVVLTLVYLGFMLGLLLALRRDHSAWWIVGVILITKSGDIGAYFTGKVIGRHKLIPWLSPGKTWEGLVGGMVFASLVGVAFAALSLRLESTADHVPYWLGGLCGVVFTLAGLIGDLTMSLFKRGAGLKDSSTLLPGLGGVMDVLDSPLFVAPVAFWMLTLLI